MINRYINMLLDWMTTDGAWRDMRRKVPGQLGLETLAVVKNEAHLGAREIGGNNRGPWVVKYKRGRDTGGAWCASLIWWATREATKRLGRSSTQVKETDGALALFRSAVRVGWLVAEGDQQAGDLVLFRRGIPGRKGDAWKRHIGILDSATDYYWAGNEGRNAKVEKHYLTDDKRKRLVGYARLP